MTEKQSNTFRWLHLSDFHVGEAGYPNASFFPHILEFIQSQPMPDSIFITGDIASTGLSEQYETFVQKFLTPLKQLAPSVPCFMIPGNHDVDRRAVEYLNRKGILDNKHQFFEPSAQGLAQRTKTVLPALQAYREQLLGSADWLNSDAGYFTHIIDHKQGRIGILGLNTAWLSIDDDDKEQLTPGKALVESGLATLQADGCEMKIVLGHHPVSWFVGSEQAPINALFRKYHVLYLHGHLDRNETCTVDAEFFALQAGVAFQPREGGGRRSRVLWGDLNLVTAKLALTPYAWSNAHQAWTIDADAFHPNAKVPGRDQWAFDLPQGPQQTLPIAPTNKPNNVETQTSLAHLPVVGGECFGRTQELATLDRAWDAPTTGIVTLVAWGGVGKTTLVGHWLNQLQQDHYRAIQRVFGWSFYSQGSAQDRQASSDAFIGAALRWFGDEHPDAGALWEKGERLATLIRRQPTLLILDGLEPLQYPPGEMQGRLKDQGMQALLRELSHTAADWGLCVISTRIKVADLALKVGVSVQELALEGLSPEAGVALLSHFGVQGSDAEVAQTVSAYDGHALTLTLLGSYLQAVHDGDIRKWDVIPVLPEEAEQGGHAKRVLERYEDWLQIPEKRVLNLLGLFDRPADHGALQALRMPVIKGLTDGLTQASWKFAIKRLREIKLLAKADVCQPEQLDCHPLVREYFSDKLRLTQSEVWKAAHYRLYEYYQALPEKHQPDTLAELEPLYRAVAHGCLAGCVQEVLHKVYEERIGRNEHYSVHKLGAFGPDLAAVAVFFDAAWSTPSAALTEVYQAWVLNLAGFDLRALGRLREATEPLSAALQRYIEQKNWTEAARNASNLSELQLTLGQVASAVETGRRSVEYADQSEDLFRRLYERTTLADALLQSGDSTAAQSLFQKAEAIQKAERPEFPTLISVEGYRFCDLLLQAHDKSVALRATTALEIVERYHWLLSIALDHLTLGRYALQQTFRQNTGDFSPSQLQLDQAVAGLRQAGSQEFLVRGLLARAACMRAQTHYPAAWKDLREAQDIAERGEMKLYLADYHLEAARLRQAQGLDFAEHVAQAKVLIEQTGYHRQDGALAELLSVKQ